MVQEAILWFLGDQGLGKQLKGLPSRRDLMHLCCAFLLFLLLSARRSSANPILPAADSTMKVSELAFSEKLSNPCALVDASRLQRGTLSQEGREHSRRIAITEMKAKASLLKENAGTILRTNFFKDCSTLELPSVAIIPSADDILESTPLSVLRLFYTSLLNHTAHVYFIAEQLQHHGQRDSTCSTPELATNTRMLASDMRELMCVLRLSTLTLQRDDDEDDTFNDSTEQILNETLTDQPLCSRRSVRDCQTVGSTVTLLRELCNYLETTVLFDDLGSAS